MDVPPAIGDETIMSDRENLADEIEETIKLQIEGEYTFKRRELIVAALRAGGDAQPNGVDCAECGRDCHWVDADPEAAAPDKFGGWYCVPCDCFTETDVEVED
jgi:hypothetical protein